jgi:hypothetical protein
MSAQPPDINNSVARHPIYLQTQRLMTCGGQQNCICFIIPILWGLIKRDHFETVGLRFLPEWERECAHNVQRYETDGSLMQACWRLGPDLHLPHPRARRSKIGSDSTVGGEYFGLDFCLGSSCFTEILL